MREPEKRGSSDACPCGADYNFTCICSPEQIKQHKWLKSLSADELRKWIRKNSCLCDGAGICNGCALADAEREVRALKKRLKEVS